MNIVFPQRHFSRAELIRSARAVALHIDNIPPKDLDPALAFTMAGLERIRAFLRHPMKIHSGYRCLALNNAVGGSEDSQHMKGEAVDWTCPAFGDSRKVALALAPMVPILGIDQLILEPGWVHTSFTLDPRHELLRCVGGKYLMGLS